MVIHVKTIKNRDLSLLKEKEVYNLLLYAIYRLNEIPEYSVLSQLIYILGKDGLLTLCSTLGGYTIRIPTITQLKELINTLLIYQYINIEKLSLKEALSKVDMTGLDYEKVLTNYKTISEIIEDGHFN